MTLQLGFLGAGFIAEHHAKMLRGSGEDARIARVHDPDAARAERFAATVGAEVIADEEVLFENIDAVYVCTWTSEHPRLVRRAVERHLPVFCEKPLAVDLEAATALAGDIIAAGLTNQVGLVLRDSPSFRLLRALIEDPPDGAVMNVVFRDDQYLPIQGVYGSSWRADASRAGSGTLLEHSIHDLDLLEWLLGPVAELSARQASFHRIPGIEDLVTVMLRFESGATATLTSVWHEVLSRPSQRRVEVFRERGWYALEGDVFGPVRVMRTAPRANVAEPADELVLADDTLLAELSTRGIELRNPDGAFVRAVQQGIPVQPDVREALRAHVLVDAAYRSACSGGAPVQVASDVPSSEAPNAGSSTTLPLV